MTEQPESCTYGHHFPSLRVEDVAFRGWNQHCIDCGAKEKATVEDAITAIAEAVCALQERVPAT